MTRLIRSLLLALVATLSLARLVRAELPEPPASADPSETQALTGRDVAPVYGVAEVEADASTPDQDLDAGALPGPPQLPAATPPQPKPSDAQLAEQHTKMLLEPYQLFSPFQNTGFLFHDINYFAVSVAGDKPSRVKFQVSVRYELLSLGISRGYSWSIAYTQKSLWDTFDFDNSSPFVENNYRPETFFSFRPSRLQYTSEFSLGVMHESNGLGLTEQGDLKQHSRSWNNVYLAGRYPLTPILGIGAFRYQIVGALRAWYPFGVSAGEYPPDMKALERRKAARMQKTLSYVSLAVDVRFSSAWLYKKQKLAHESRGLLRIVAKPYSAETSLYIPLPFKGWIPAALYVQFFAGRAEYLKKYNAPTTNLYLGLGLL